MVPSVSGYAPQKRCFFEPISKSSLQNAFNFRSMYRKVPLVLLAALYYNIYPPPDARRAEHFERSCTMVKIENQKGAITIDPEVFANLAGDAATSCFGVKAMAAQAKDGGVFQLRRESMSKGIETQLGEDGSVSLGLHIAVDHGVNLMALCRSIINEVSYKVSKATGVPVKRVDVYVDTMLID